MGFRQDHPGQEAEGFCVITFVHPRTDQRVYSRLRGLPFGMGSVVNQFNRLPHLKSAVLRRTLAMLDGHYFDDELRVYFSSMTSLTQRLSHRLSTMWGIKYNEKICNVCPHVHISWAIHTIGQSGWPTTQ